MTPPPDNTPREPHPGFEGLLKEAASNHARYREDFVQRVLAEIDGDAAAAIRPFPG